MYVVDAVEQKNAFEITSQLALHPFAKASTFWLLQHAAIPLTFHKSGENDKKKPRCQHMKPKMTAADNER